MRANKLTICNIVIWSVALVLLGLFFLGGRHDVAYMDLFPVVEKMSESDVWNVSNENWRIEGTYVSKTPKGIVFSVIVLLSARESSPEGREIAKHAANMPFFLEALRKYPDINFIRVLEAQEASAYLGFKRGWITMFQYYECSDVVRDWRLILNSCSGQSWKHSSENFMNSRRWDASSNDFLLAQKIAPVLIHEFGSTDSVCNNSKFELDAVDGTEREKTAGELGPAPVIDQRDSVDQNSRKPVVSMPKKSF